MRFTRERQWEKPPGWSFVAVFFVVQWSSFVFFVVWYERQYIDYINDIEKLLSTFCCDQNNEVVLEKFPQLKIFMEKVKCVGSVYREQEAGKTSVNLDKNSNPKDDAAQQTDVASGQRDESRKPLSRVKRGNCGDNETDRAPSLEYEKTKRRIRSGIDDLWNFIVATTMETAEQIDDRLLKLLDAGAEMKLSLLHDVNKLFQLDGFDFWWSKEESYLSKLVQKRLDHLQNPASCQNAKKLVCSFKQCDGFGCQIQHLVYCLNVAYCTQRTMVLLPDSWPYENTLPWENIFQPLSRTCSASMDFENWTDDWDDADDHPVVSLPPLKAVVRDIRRHCFTLAVPLDLVSRLTKITESPDAWWAGQMVKFLMRLQPDVEKMTLEFLSVFKHPVVGVHLRKSNKIENKDPDFHSVVDRYMLYVEEYYLQLSLSGNDFKRRIYLASEDPEVFDEVRNKYPDYELFGEPRRISKKANEHSEMRNTTIYLYGIIMDVLLLAQSDFIVCSFTSEMCRLLYEIQQTQFSNAAARFKSLDGFYYFDGLIPHRAVAVVKHNATSESEIDLNIGDQVEIHKRLGNGFSEGYNIFSRQNGIFPSFKVEDIIETADMPTYPHVSDCQ